ncbi:MAG: DUF2809 domain-containing protein [Planctomycetaceae bacterium]
MSYEMRLSRLRLTYGGCMFVVIAAGLASRRYRDQLPAFVAEFAGDTLWALMVFLGVSLLMPNAPATRRGLAAIGFAFAIEFSQLYHAPWIDALRHTTFGGLVLGIGFLWTDLICYSAGVLAGVAADTAIRIRR